MATNRQIWPLCSQIFSNEHFTLKRVVTVTHYSCLFGFLPFGLFRLVLMFFGKIRIFVMSAIVDIVFIHVNKTHKHKE